MGLCGGAMTFMGSNKSGAREQTGGGAGENKTFQYGCSTHLNLLDYVVWFMIHVYRRRQLIYYSRSPLLAHAFLDDYASLDEYRCREFHRRENYFMTM
jgi:hypothetical protein